MKYALGIGNFKLVQDQFLSIKDSKARNLVKQMLSPSPENRITLKAALKHEWFDDRTSGSKDEPLSQILRRDSQARNPFHKILKMAKACRSADQCDDK